MSKISQRVSARLSNAEHTIQATQTHGAKAAAGAAQRLRRLSVAEMERFVEAVVACLQEVTAALTAREQGYADEQADDPAAFQRRDEAQAALNAELVEVRRFVRQHAPQRLKELGLALDPPEGLAAFTHYAHNAAQQMKNAGGKIAGPLKMTLDLKEAGASLAERADAMQAAESDVLRERRELDVALVERDRALAEWQLVYSAAGDILSGLYRLAGEATLAAKLRPTQRRVRGEEVINPGEGAAQPVDDSPAAQAEDDTPA